MDKGKAIFVTMLITLMLIVIDIFLFTLSATGFLVLTGALVFCGILRLACDFYHWLCQTRAEPLRQIIEPDGNGRVLCSNQEADRAPKAHDEDGTIMKVLNEDV